MTISVTIQDNRTANPADMRRVTVVAINANGDRTPETMLAAGASHTTNVYVGNRIELDEIEVDANGNPVIPDQKV